MCFLKISIRIFVEGYLFSLNLWYIIARIPLSLEKNLILFSSDFTLRVKKKKIMKRLIIDATREKVILGLISNRNIYTGRYINSKKNYDKLVILINKFLLKHKTNLDKINRIYVNRGPGSYVGIRNSLSIVKAIYLSKKIDYFSYSYFDFKEKTKIEDQPNILKNLRKLPSLCNKFKVKKNLIKPIYLS